MTDLDFSRLTWETLSAYVSKGLIFSFQLTLMAMLGGIILGTLLAMMRLSGRKWLEVPAAIYVDTLRSIPLVLVILWVYLLLPYATQAMGWGNFAPETTALITFTLFEATYYSEIMRAGIQSVSKGQSFAGYALGMNYRQTMSLVVLPQAFRNMLPVLLTQTIVLFQDTSLVYVLSITDFLGAASKIAQRDGRLVEMYLFAAVVYFAVCFIASLLVRRLQRRVAIIR